MIRTVRKQSVRGRRVLVKASPASGVVSVVLSLILVRFEKLEVERRINEKNFAISLDLRDLCETGEVA